MGVHSGSVTPSGARTPISAEERPGIIINYCIEKIHNYQTEHLYKFIGAGVNRDIVRMSPALPSRLWAELDIVPMVFQRGLEPALPQRVRHGGLTVDEEADSMARKCLLYERL